LQQTLINKNGTVSGNVDDEQGQNLNNVLAKYFDNQAGTFFGQDNTNTSGDYLINFQYQGYENDPNDEHSPVQFSRTEFSKTGYLDTLIVKNFVANDVVNMVMREEPSTVYEFTLHYIDIGDGINLTDGDITLHWPDGDITYTNNNGVINVSKELDGVNANTKIPITHTNSSQYQPWIIGRTFELVQYGLEPIFQNADWLTDAELPLQTVDSLGTIYIGSFDREVTTTFGGTLQTDGPEIVFMMSRDPGVVIHSKQKLGGSIYEQRNVQLEENLTTGEPMSTTELNRARDQQQTVIDAYIMPVGIVMEVHNPIERISVNSATWQQYEQEGRENLNHTYFSNTSPGNAVTIVLDPELRKKNSLSKCSVADPNSIILEETFAQYSNTTASSTYIAASVNGGLTQAAYMMLRVQAWMATWTQYALGTLNEKPVFELNKEYTSTSTGKDFKFEFKEN